MKLVGVVRRVGRFVCGIIIVTDAFLRRFPKLASVTRRRKRGIKPMLQDRYKTVAQPQFDDNETDIIYI